MFLNPFIQKNCILFNLKKKLLDVPMSDQAIEKKTRRSKSNPTKKKKKTVRSKEKEIRPKKEPADNDPTQATVSDTPHSIM